MQTLVLFLFLFCEGKWLYVECVLYMLQQVWAKRKYSEFRISR